MVECRLGHSGKPPVERRGLLMGYACAGVRGREGKEEDDDEEVVVVVRRRRWKA